MSRSFLVGRFLPAHGDAFGRLDRTPTVRAFDADGLAPRLKARSGARAARRTAYRTTLLVGLALAVALTWTAFSLQLTPSSTPVLSSSDQELVQMEEIVQTVQVVKPPPPPRPMVPVAVPDDELLAEDDLDLNDLFDLDAPVAAAPPPPPADDEPAEPEIFTVVEQMPSMVGGYAALMADLDYPEVARRAGLDGVVVVQVTVSERGLPADAVVVKGVHEALDKEAVRAVLAQTFEPGMQRSRPVPVRTTISVRFRLVS